MFTLLIAAILVGPNVDVFSRTDAVGDYARCVRPVISGSEEMSNEQLLEATKRSCGIYRDRALKIFVPEWQQAAHAKQPIRDDVSAEKTLLSVLVMANFAHDLRQEQGQSK